jgi:hypothetical protein
MEQTPPIVPAPESRPGPAGWLEVWGNAVTRPSERTFVEITESPNASSTTAFLWVFIAGTVSALVSGLIQSFLVSSGVATQSMPGMEELLGGSGSGAPLVGSSITAVLCGAPVAGVFSVISLAIGTAIIQWIAKLFGGVGSFGELAYGIAAISVPVSLVTMLLSPFGLVPILNICTGLLTFAVAIYALYLQILAVKAVNRFGWGAAVGSVFIPFLVIILVCGCLVIGGMMLLGPAIGDVFSEINRSLQTAP